jgi:hypothetical protein
MRKSAKKLQKRRGGKSMRKTHRRGKMIKGGVLTIPLFQTLSNIIFAGKTLHGAQHIIAQKNIAALKRVTPRGINFSELDMFNRVNSIEEAKEKRIVRPRVPAVIDNKDGMTLLIHDDDFKDLPVKMQLKFGERIWVRPPGPGHINGYYIHPIECDKELEQVFKSHNAATNEFNFSPPVFQSTIESKYNPKELDEKVFGFTNYGWGQSPPQMSFL